MPIVGPAEGMSLGPIPPVVAPVGRDRAALARAFFRNRPNQSFTRVRFVRVAVRSKRRSLAEYLARLQKALGANAVAIEIHELEPSGAIDAAHPLTIRPLYMDGVGTDYGSFGILMPIRGD